MPNRMDWKGTIEERIIRNTTITPTCHIWNAYRDKDGYGNIKWKGKWMRVHRVIWIIRNGELKKGEYICHKCDNPSCLNIEHLFLGDVIENSKDKVKKDRQAKGSKNGAAKLTEEKIIEIRDLYDKNVFTLKEIGSKFGVTYAMIHLIAKRKNWNHI